MIILTLVFTQGSFAFANTEEYVAENDLQAAEEELMVSEAVDEADAEDNEEILTAEQEEPSAEEAVLEEPLPKKSQLRNLQSSLRKFRKLKPQRKSLLMKKLRRPKKLLK